MSDPVPQSVLIKDVYHMGTIIKPLVESALQAFKKDYENQMQQQIQESHQNPPVTQSTQSEDAMEEDQESD